MTYMEWFTCGLLFIFLELFIPGVFIIWFGFAAFASGIIIIFYNLSLIEQALVFSGFSAFFLILGWFIYGKFKNKEVESQYRYLNDPAGALINKTFLLSEDTIDGRSKAIVGDTLWIVECQEELKKGDKIKVIGIIDGVILKAEKA